MARRLTDDDIQNARLRGKRYKLYDTSGLFLLVAPAGGKWWRFKYRFKGKEKQLAFGTYPKVSLTEARALRDNARQMVKQGIDPSALRKAEKAERKKAERGQIESVLRASVRLTMDGVIELWKGSNVMCLSTEEARFVAKQLSVFTRSRHGTD